MYAEYCSEMAVIFIKEVMVDFVVHKELALAVSQLVLAVDNFISTEYFQPLHVIQSFN